MSNDMKLIMEEWRRTLKEFDPGFGDFMPGPDGESVASLIQQADREQVADIFAEIGEFVLQILDPTGVSSWDDLEESWNKYTQELDLNNPVSVKTFVDASMVLFDAIDSIPVVAFFAKPITVPGKLLKLARRAQKATEGSKALPTVNKLAKKSADKLEDKLNRMISQKGSGLANFKANERYYKKFARSFSDNITGKPKDFNQNFSILEKNKRSKCW